jgi:hypothetical protein
MSPGAAAVTAACIDGSVVATVQLAFKLVAGTHHTVGAACALLAGPSRTRDTAIAVTHRNLFQLFMDFSFDEICCNAVLSWVEDVTSSEDRRRTFGMGPYFGEDFRAKRKLTEPESTCMFKIEHLNQTFLF